MNGLQFTLIRHTLTSSVDASVIFSLAPQMAADEAHSANELTGRSAARILRGCL